MLHSLSKVGCLRLVESYLVFEGLCAIYQSVLVASGEVQLGRELRLLAVEVISPAPEVLDFLGTKVLQAAL